MGIKWNKGWENEFEKALNLPKELRIDPSQSESQQLSDLERQFKKTGGLVPTRNELRGILKDMKKKL